MNRKLRLTVFVVLILTAITFAETETYNVYEVQYNPADPNYSSLENEVIHFEGGIVIHKFPGNIPRVILSDPNYPDGWGAIQVRDRELGELYDSVNAGDWVSLHNVTVVERWGNTMLKYDSSSSFTVEATGLDLPEPIIISPNDLPSPLEGPAYEWYVADHAAEKYEGMLIQIQNVKITEVNKGVADPPDNYVLTDTNDPNFSSWASDYMNSDKAPDPVVYHEYINMETYYCDLTGIVEQSLGGDYDFYQLLTRNTSDIRPELEADITSDCAVDMFDLAMIGQYWLRGTE